MVEAPCAAERSDGESLDNVREIIKKTKYFGFSFTIFVKKLKYFNIFFALAIELNQAMQAIQAKSNNASAKRPLASLMRGRLSWLLLAAALQGSASTQSPGLPRCLFHRVPQSTIIGSRQSNLTENFNQLF